MALIRTINTTAKGKQTQGFTLIEVLIAGLLLAVVMIAVSNFSTTALSNSSKQSKRIRIETAINENMQLVHQADSILTLESIPEESRIKACSNPAEHLKTTIESPSELAHVPAPVIIDAQGSNIIQRTIETFHHRI